MRCRLVSIWLVLAGAPSIRPESIEQLQAAVRRNPSNAHTWKELGLALTGQRKQEPAVTAFSRACELDPKEEDACYFLARQLFSLGRYSDAVDPFAKAVAAAPPAMLSRTHRAAALNRIGEGSPEEAERHFRLAVNNSEGPAEIRAEAQTDYGGFLLRQARPAEAAAALERAVKIYPGLARAHAELGRVLLHLERPHEAAGSLERAVALDADSPGIRLLLGRAYIALGKTGEGEHQLRLGREAWARTAGLSHR
jgi:Tfp pilus assembly protein PilF